MPEPAEPTAIPEQTWQIKVSQDACNPANRRFCVRAMPRQAAPDQALHSQAAPDPPPQEWQEFKHQDDLLRHLWHLLDKQAGLR